MCIIKIHTIVLSQYLYLRWGQISSFSTLFIKCLHRLIYFMDLMFFVQYYSIFDLGQALLCVGGNSFNCYYNAYLLFHFIIYLLCLNLALKVLWAKKCVRQMMPVIRILLLWPLSMLSVRV